MGSLNKPYLSSVLSVICYDEDINSHNICDRVNVKAYQKHRSE